MVAAAAAGGRRSDVRQLLQRDGECSYEVAVSATFDGWDQGRGKEGLRRLLGQQEQEVCESGERGEVGKLGGHSVYRFNPKPFFDSSGWFCFDFLWSGFDFLFVRWLARDSLVSKTFQFPSDAY